MIVTLGPLKYFFRDLKQMSTSLAMNIVPQNRSGQHQTEVYHQDCDRLNGKPPDC